MGEVGRTHLGHGLEQVLGALALAGLALEGVDLVPLDHVGLAATAEPVVALAQGDAADDPVAVALLVEANVIDGARDPGPGHPDLAVQQFAEHQGLGAGAARICAC